MNVVTVVVRIVVRKRPRPSWLPLLAVALLVSACGKKGPPLAPVIHIPAAIDKITVQRSGRDVFITVTVPAKNIDASIPVDIGRIEIYGYTGRTPPPRTRWAELGDLVATIPVIPPPAAGAPPPATPPDPSTGAAAGQIVTVIDRLTANDLVQGRVDLTPAVARGAARRGPPTPIADAPVSDVLRRFYVAFAFSARGRPGPPGADSEFALVDTPEPPAFVRTPYTDTTVVVEWPPSGGIVGYLFNRQLPPEDAPLDENFEPVVTVPVTGAPAVGPAAVPAPTGPVRYNVYREDAPDPLAPIDAAAPAPWTMTPKMPLNPSPLDSMTFSDPVQLDHERCYTVRALRGAPPNAIEGDASEPACFAFTDVFAPAPPQRLVAVADQGGISLIWEPNGEPDIGGYLVLRGEASDATLQPLTPTPVVEPHFRDTHVTSGRKYVYAVLAVDSHLPLANISGESNRAEETAR